MNEPKSEPKVFKILYKEMFPDKIEKMFSSSEEYNLFFKQRLDEVSKQLDWYNPSSKYKYGDWQHIRITLKKDGTPRKYFNPTHLQSKRTRTLQKEKFKEYQKRIKEEREKKRKLKQELDQMTYNKAISVLIQANIDLNRLNIRIKK